MLHASPERCIPWWLKAILAAVLIFILLAQIISALWPSFVIEPYGLELRDKYIETLTKYKDPKYSKFPRAGPSISVNVPFISLISIVVKNNTKRTAHWLLSTTPKDIIQNEKIIKIQIEDILKPVSEKQLRFVLIEGEPGIGKSTLAKELVLRWANRSDKLMNNYDIVLLIQLRFATYHNATSIEDLFVDLDDQSVNERDLKLEIKKRKGEGILWILDGFDELPSHLKNDSVLMKLIKSEILPKSTVIVTSRPVASDHLLSFLHNHDSKCISLRGFDSNKTLEYASKYFNDKEILSKFHSYYSGNLVIESMLYNPLNCFIVCTIFNDFIATNNEQYPKTMTSLYNHYIRVILKRHLIDTGLISDLNYDMPQHLMLETDFNNPLLQSVWKNFSLLSKIAYDGVMKQEYIFGKELHNVTKLSMMDTIVNFFAFEKDESSSFLHTTLQEYFAAVHLVNTKLNITIQNSKFHPNLKVVLTFYVGICKMTSKKLDSTVLDILKQNMTVVTNEKFINIGSILLGCLYEDDSLIYNIGFSFNYHLLYTYEDNSHRTNFDYYIFGYLVAVHNIACHALFKTLDHIKAFNKGLQSHSATKGKLLVAFYIEGHDERQKGFKELLLMPSHLVIEIQISPSNNSEVFEIFQMCSLFQLLEVVAFFAPNWQWSSSEDPLLKLKKLNKLVILLNHPHDDLVTLQQLVAPVRPLKILHVENFGSPYNKILNIIKMQTSLDQLKITDNVDIHRHGTEAYSSVWDVEPTVDQYIIWTKSTNNLMVYYYETFFYHIKMRTLPTIQLSSFTSFTYIRTSKTKTADVWNRWIFANVTVHSESTTLTLHLFIDAFSECLKLLQVKNIVNNTIKIKLNSTFTCTRHGKI